MKGTYASFSHPLLSILLLLQSEKFGNQSCNSAGCIWISMHQPRASKRRRLRRHPCLTRAHYQPSCEIPLGEWHKKSNADIADRRRSWPISGSLARRTCASSSSSTEIQSSSNYLVLLQQNGRSVRHVAGAVGNRVIAHRTFTWKTDWPLEGKFRTAFRQVIRRWGIEMMESGGGEKRVTWLLEAESRNDLRILRASEKRSLKFCTCVKRFILEIYFSAHLKSNGVVLGSSSSFVKVS